LFKRTRKGDGCIFRDKGGKRGQATFWLKDLGNGLNWLNFSVTPLHFKPNQPDSLTQFLSHIFTI